MKKILALLGGLTILGYLISTSLVVVDETQTVIVTLFNKPVRVVKEAGLVVKWPDPIQTVIRLDARLQSLDSNLGEYLTRDKKNLVASSFILWRIQDAERFIQSVRSKTNAEKRLTDLVGSELGVALGEHVLQDFLTTSEEGSKIGEITKTVLERTKEAALRDFGIELLDVQLRRLGFPTQNLRSVYERMRAERERIAKKYRAEGEEEASKIRSQTDKEVRELLAEAYRDAQITKGQGEAEAMRIYAESFSKDARFYELTRTLETYKKILDDKTTLILSTESPLFRYLETPPAGVGR